MFPICEHGHILTAYPAVKMAWHIGSVCWSSDEEPAKLSGRIYFLHEQKFLGQKFLAPFLVSVSSALVSDVTTFADFAMASVSTCPALH